VIFCDVNVFTPRLILAENSLAPTVRTQKGKLMIEDCSVSGGKIGITAENGCQMDIKRSVLQSFLFTNMSFLPTRVFSSPTSCRHQHTHTHTRTRTAPPTSCLLFVYQYHPHTCALENCLHFSSAISHQTFCLLPEVFCESLSV